MSDLVAPSVPYTVDGDVVRSGGEVRHRISGTAIGALLGLSPWQSPFTQSARMLGFWDEDVSRKPQIIAGKMLEERIIDHLALNNPGVGMFIKAEEVFEKREGSHDSWVSDFEDDVFSGHVDGIVSRDGQDYILEIKTTSRRNIDKGAWADHPPDHYLWQVYLYNAFITRQTKAYFGLGILEEGDYDNPNLWIPNRQNTRLYEVTIDLEAVDRTLENLRAQYGRTIGAGVTYPANPDLECDRRLLTHLKDLASDSDHLRALVTELVEVKALNETYRKGNAVNEAREEELRERVKDVMTAHGVSQAGQAVLRTSTRRSFDFKKAAADGFDVSAYTTETTVNSLRLKE